MPGQYFVYVAAPEADLPAGGDLRVTAAGAILELPEGAALPAPWAAEADGPYLRGDVVMLPVLADEQQPAEDEAALWPDKADSEAALALAAKVATVNQRLGVAGGPATREGVTHG